MVTSGQKLHARILFSFQVFCYIFSIGNDLPTPLKGQMIGPVIVGMKGHPSAPEPFVHHFVLFLLNRCKRWSMLRVSNQAKTLMDFFSLFPWMTRGRILVLIIFSNLSESYRHISVISSRRKSEGLFWLRHCSFYGMNRKFKFQWQTALLWENLYK